MPTFFQWLANGVLALCVLFALPAHAVDPGSRLEVVSGNAQLLRPGQSSQDLVVVLKDPQGAAISGALMQFSVQPSTAASLAKSDRQTDALGRAVAAVVASSATGSFEVIASLVEFPGVQARFNLMTQNELAAGTTFTIVSGGTQNLPPNTESAPLVAQLKGADGQPIAGRVIRAEAVPPASATLSSQLGITDAAGRVQFTATPRVPGAVAVVLSVLEQGTLRVQFDLTGGLAFIPGLDARAQSVAQAIDGLCPQLATIPPEQLTAGQRDLQRRCGEVVGAAGGAAANSAISQLRADGAAPQASAAFGGRDVQMGNVNLRFDALRTGVRGLSLSGLNVQTANGVLPIGSLLTAASASEESSAGFGSRWSGFVTGQVARTDEEKGDGAPGFDGRGYGLTAGLDYRLNDQWVLGAALGYDTSDSELLDDRGSVDSKQITGTFYASWVSPSNFYVDFLAAYSRINFDLERVIRYRISAGANADDTQVAQAALASPDGESNTFALSLGRDFHSGAWTTSAYLRGELTQVDLDGYDEVARLPEAPGSGLMLRINARELESHTVRFGARASYAHSASFGVLLPSVRAEWVRELQDDPQLINASFLADPGSRTIRFVGSQIDDGYGNLGLSLTSVLANGRSLFFSYERRFGQDRRDQDIFTLGGRAEF